MQHAGTLKSISFLIMVILFSALSASSPASTTFNLKIIDNDPMPTIWAKALGDFNGDGRTDIVIAGREGIAVWYENPGSAAGKWVKRTIYHGPKIGLEGGATGDIDNDGDIDIILGGHYTHVVYCLENPGRGKGKWKLHNLGGPMSDATYLHDFDGDGKLDIVTRASQLWSKGVGRDLYIWKQGGDPFDHMQWQRFRTEVGTGEHFNIGDVDQDGKVDIVFANKWLKNTGTINVGRWKEYTFTSAWTHDRTYPFLADINNDGRADIVLTPTERDNQTYKTAWYEAPPDRTSSNWTEHIIENNIQCVTHALGVYDFDCDGDMDVFTAEMEQSKDPDEVRIYYNADGKGTAWEKQVLSTAGSHWCQFFDIEGDGDIDIFGANHGITTATQAQLWENKTDPGKPAKNKHKLCEKINDFTYIQLDDSKESRAFGLAAGDLTGDGLKDIITGRYFYRNCGGDLTGKWQRTMFPVAVDAMLILNVDDDRYGDVIGEWLPSIYWLEAADTEGKSFTARLVGNMPKGRHGESGQGYTLAQIVPGGKPEIILASSGLYYFEIGDNPQKGKWPRTTIAEVSSEEGIAAADIDRDGDIDVCACINKSDNPNVIAWYQNPGDGRGNWKYHVIGSLYRYADRFYAVDINGDGRVDLVVSTANGIEDGVYWFQAPRNPQSVRWVKHTVVVQPYCNSMDVADMDEDGDIDIIVGQHRDERKLQIFENDGTGRFREHLVDSGKESHLGARVADLDGDGDKEIISICWDNFRYVHLWRNNRR